MRFLLGMLTLAALLLVVGIILVWAGAYDFAASRRPLPLTERAIDYALARSVAVRAGGILVPPLDDARMLRAGARHYREMCRPCHGAPGQKPEQFVRGLTPAPPDLENAMLRWRAAELFWIVKHGIKMSGMPAWGGTLTDQEIWNIVAFLRRLPGMPEEQYLQLGAGDGHPPGTSGNPLPPAAD